MGHQEASPPRQRHRVPHHRRHHGRRHRTAAAAQASQAANHCGPPLAVGRSNRGPHAPDTHAAVENWLEQLEAPVPATRLVSPPSPIPPVHRRKPSRSQDSDGLSCRKRSRRAYQLWRPQHIPPAKGSSPPRLLPLTKSHKKGKPCKRNSDDSSLISSSKSRELRGRDWDYTKTTPERERSPRNSRLGETEAGATGALSPTSHVPMAFEKRPRHKTRPDKYDTEKSNDLKRRESARGQDERHSRGSKPKKRKHVLNGRNVMKNFTSDAVASGRITVHPNLKPGLFDNKRVPKEHPISDLLFSEMPFPAHQEHDLPQQKVLSGSRVRERQRESRELEQVSSFFQPACADIISRNSKHAKFKDDEAVGNKKPAYRDIATSAFRRDSFATSSSPSVMTRSYHEEYFLSLENSCSVPTVTAGGPDCRPSSSKTTYFTWSTSQHSPQAKSCRVNNTRPETMEPARSATPEDIREALFTTRVYENTGIRSYDDSNAQQTNGLKAICASSSVRSNMTGHGDAYEGRIPATDHKLNTKRRCGNDTKASMAWLARLEDRWNTILPPEWKLRRSSEDEMSLVNNRRDDIEMLRNVVSPSRQEIAQEARVKPVRQHAQAHHVYRQGNPDSNLSMDCVSKSPVSVFLDPKPILAGSAPAHRERTTIASRDAMPPAVPSPRFSPLHTVNYSLGHDLDSSIPVKTTRPLTNHARVSKSGHAGLTDPYEPAGEGCKLSRHSKKAIPTIDSASWVPQAATSGTAICDREQTLSRLSMKSPIYENQDKEMETSRFTPPPIVCMNEPMAHFIARIEKEMDGPCLNEYGESESIGGDCEFPVYQGMNKYDIRNPHLPHSEGPQIDYSHLSVAADGPELKDVSETGTTCHRHEPTSSIRDNLAITYTEDQRDDDIDDFREMSSFWRPNRFSQF
ncbi:hypothetical protein F4678DRAFT_470485 [Xylaria arbuscula]|nr:hypothetical protein F4678DRAFT_470485 [Xylaria arbuscula]